MNMPDIASQNKVLLSVQHLTVALPAGMDREYAVEDISFDLIAGEILCIIGESGSGKSVTAHAAMGLLAHALTVRQGKIILNTQDILTLTPAAMRSLQGKTIAMILQDPLSALNPVMSIGKQISEVLTAHTADHTLSSQDKVIALLEEVGLPEPEIIQHQYPFNLSGGQRQRVMIAMALALDPDVLIADEPTTALDVTTQAQILALIRRLQHRKKMSVMFITHDFGVVEEIADRVVVMRGGKVIEQGVTDQVLRQPTHAYTRQLIQAVPQLEKHSRPRLSDAPVILEAINLCKTYRKSSGLFGRSRQVIALNNVSFTLRKGETLGVIGESGSGKSSLGKVLVKLLNADSGQILFNGHDIIPVREKDFRPTRPLIQMIFQDPFASLNPRQTIGTLLSIGPRTHGGMTDAEIHAKALRLLALVGLDSGAYDRYPHEFSGGQRQRIGIARALMFDPLLLVADESVSALDVSVQAQVLELLAEIQQKTRVAIVFITHDLRVASQLCDDLLVLYRGNVVEQGTARKLLSSPEHAYTQTLVDAIPGHH